MRITFEATVRGIKGDEGRPIFDSGLSGLLLAVEGAEDATRKHYYSRLDLGDLALRQFHIGQKVRVTVEAVEE